MTCFALPLSPGLLASVSLLIHACVLREGSHCLPIFLHLLFRIGRFIVPLPVCLSFHSWYPSIPSHSSVGGEKWRDGLAHMIASVSIAVDTDVDVSWMPSHPVCAVIIMVTCPLGVHGTSMHSCTIGAVEE